MEIHLEKKRDYIIIGVSALLALFSFFFLPFATVSNDGGSALAYKAVEIAGFNRFSALILLAIALVAGRLIQSENPFLLDGVPFLVQVYWTLFGFVVAALLTLGLMVRSFVDLRNQVSIYSPSNVHFSLGPSFGAYLMFICLSVVIAMSVVIYRRQPTLLATYLVQQERQRRISDSLPLPQYPVQQQNFARPPLMPSPPYGAPQQPPVPQRVSAVSQPGPRPPVQQRFFPAPQQPPMQHSPAPQQGLLRSPLPPAAQHTSGTQKAVVSLPASVPPQKPLGLPASAQQQKSFSLHAFLPQQPAQLQPKPAELSVPPAQPEQKKGLFSLPALPAPQSVQAKEQSGKNPVSQFGPFPMPQPTAQPAEPQGPKSEPISQQFMAPLIKPEERSVAQQGPKSEPISQQFMAPLIKPAEQPAPETPTHIPQVGQPQFLKLKPKQDEEVRSLTDVAAEQANNS